jgi:beta-D-xylosidase 4
MGSVIGIELRALWLEAVAEYHTGTLPKIGLDCWSPNVGIVRDPRWGEHMLACLTVTVKKCYYVCS